jgi:hypothetical protein
LTLRPSLAWLQVDHEAQMLTIKSIARHSSSSWMTEGRCGRVTAERQKTSAPLSQMLLSQSTADFIGDSRD